MIITFKNRPAGRVLLLVCCVLLLFSASCARALPSWLLEDCPITLNGVALSEYSLVVRSSIGRPIEAARVFADYIKELSGIELQIKYNSDEKAENEILFGMYSRDGSRNESLGRYEYEIYEKDGSIIIDSDPTVMLRAVESFISLYFEESADGKIDAVIEEYFYGLLIKSETNGLVFQREAVTKLADGVTSSVRHYEDYEGKPVVAYVLTIEPGAATILLGTPGDGTETANVRQNVADQCRAAYENGKNVIAAVNAGFFRIDSDYSPRSVCIKDGEILANANTTWPFFGFTDEGYALAGSAALLRKNIDNLYTAVGGSHLLLSRGRIENVGLGESLGYTRHPRTAAGAKEDGTAVLMVVDGRQSSYSNGASLSDLALMLKEIGVTDAVNLDGGGSSSYVLLKGSKYSALNKPSDGSLRRVYDSLLVALP